MEKGEKEHKQEQSDSIIFACAEGLQRGAVEEGEPGLFRGEALELGFKD